MLFCFSAPLTHETKWIIGMCFTGNADDASRSLNNDIHNFIFLCQCNSSALCYQFPPSYWWLIVDDVCDVFACSEPQRQPQQQHSEVGQAVVLPHRGALCSQEARVRNGVASSRARDARVEERKWRCSELHARRWRSEVDERQQSCGKQPFI